MSRESSPLRGHAVHFGRGLEGMAVAAEKVGARGIEHIDDHHGVWRFLRPDEAATQKSYSTKPQDSEAKTAPSTP